MSLFTEPISDTNSNLVLMNYLKKSKKKLKEWMYDLLYTLYENEEGYTESLYDGVGWTEEVKTFLRYNANKALMNLGQDPLFPDSADDVNPIVMNGIQQEHPTTTSSLKSEMVTFLVKLKLCKTMTTTTVWTNSIIPELITNIMACLKQPWYFCFCFLLFFKLIDWILYDKIVIEIEVITMLKQEKLDNILER